MKIKQLQWYKNPNDDGVTRDLGNNFGIHEIKSSKNSSYYLIAVYEKVAFMFGSHEQNSIKNEYKTLDEAKQACQDYLEQYVLSFIEKE